MDGFKNAALSKDEILSLTNSGYDIFKYYIPDFKEVGKTFRSPLRVDNNPSVNIFRSENGEYLYKDFADGTLHNAIDYVKAIKSSGYYESLKIINKDLNLKVDEGMSFEGGGSIDYWSDYNVTAEVLEKYDVLSLKNFNTNTGVGVSATKENPIFAFKVGEQSLKIYEPLAKEKKFKHQWVGEKPINYSNVFGVKQLPKHCKTILITEGLKDCVVANANFNKEGIWAVGIDNVSTKIDNKTLNYLREKCDNLVLCLDIDEIGLKSSGKKSQEYGLRNFILPALLKDKSGKDISDWVRLKLDNSLLLEELNKVLASPEPSTLVVDETMKSPILKQLLANEIKVSQYAAQEIVYATPLVNYGTIPLIRKGTINILQGKYGSHKSRLGELICSLLLSDANCKTNYLNLGRIEDEKVTVCYIDTERNIKEELPSAIQSIKKKSCIAYDEQNGNFRFTSIKNIERKDRLEGIKVFIEEVRAGTSNPLFVLLDVATDCVSDFNSASESMKLFDYLGNLCDNYDATFLLILHENPNSEKARGHTGTEGANKASTVIHIGFEKDAKNQDTELIKLKFLKIRSAKRPESMHLVYSEAERGLILADNELVRQRTAERRQVADTELIIDKLGYIINESVITQRELIEILKAEFDCSENTLKDRLKEIEEQQLEIINIKSESCTLKIHTAAGKATTYELVVQEIEK